MYQISPSGLALLATFEGLVLHPYKDKTGKPTIGIGSTYYPDGRSVSMTDPVITNAQAYAYARNAIAHDFIPAITKLVTVPLNQNQVDALVCFCYNVGTGHEGFAGSHLLKAINAKGSNAEITSHFNSWVYVNHVVDSWQVSRRKREAALFCS